MRAHTTGSYIAAARKVHGSRYDYSALNYIDSSTKVIIICREHGPFQQMPDKHLHGQKCRKCSDKERAEAQALSPDEFITAARKKHKNRYKYTNTKYVNSLTNVIIDCEEHGPFVQAPFAHLRGSGCPRCASESLADTNRYTPEEFVAAAHAKHGNRYNYSLTHYVDRHTKVTIICKDHGEFQQRPLKHLEGNDCPKCAVAVRQLATRSTQADFIHRAREIHGKLYDYSQVQYKNRQAPVTIVCRDHGPFEQTPANHLQGKGCPACGIEARIQKRKAGS
jgi:hypothetical protein